MTSRGLCLDSGALIAIERGDPRVRALLRRAVTEGLAVDVPAGVVAQVWRGGARQARLGHLLDSPEVTCIALDESTARAVGGLCARVGATDVIDGHVALHARSRGLSVVTSDPADIAAFGPGIRVVPV